MGSDFREWAGRMNSLPALIGGMTTICMFPGQGAQKPGMGNGLFEQFPEEVAQADEILGYSIRELCLEDPQANLGNTAYTQPALFTVAALGFMARQAEGAEKVDYAVGHSLGEYNALFAAGAFDFATGLRLVQHRGHLMSQVVGGGMAAVIGLASESIRSALDDAGFGEIDLANQNSPKQTVIAGKKADIDACGGALEAAGGKVIPLAVSGAFHSRLMKPVAEQFRAFVSQTQFAPLQIPVIANATAQAYSDDEIGDTLVRQIDHPVLWSDTIQFLLSQPEPTFEEIGSGKVLSGLLRQIKAASR